MSLPHPTAEQRCQSDPQYRNLVKALYQLIAGGQYTPSELREAIILAATQYEINHSHQLPIVEKERAKQ